MELTGWAAWDAAVHCAACTASEQAPLADVPQLHSDGAVQPPASTLAQTMCVSPSLATIASYSPCPNTKL
jgi:hypothetical protein